MKTKLLIGISALSMAILGVISSFFPQEILVYSGSIPQDFGILLVQIIGALYIGFAILNWMSRANLIGGIYNRHIAMSNFFHFAIGGVVLLKSLMDGQNDVVIIVSAVVYSAFAISFGIVLFTHPNQVGKSEQ